MLLLPCLFYKVIFFSLKLWVKNAKRLDLQNQSSEYSYNNCKLCSIHFEPSMLLPSNSSVVHLKNDAVPSMKNDAVSSFVAYVGDLEKK